MSSLSGNFPRFKGNIRFRRRFQMKSCILDLPDHPLEKICQNLLDGQSLLENLRIISAFRLTCSRFCEIANQSKSRFILCVEDCGTDAWFRSAMVGSYISGDYKFICLSDNLLQMVNDRMLWRCRELELISFWNYQSLIHNLQKYGRIFNNIETVRFSNPQFGSSPASISDFIKAGQESFFAPFVNFQVFNHREFDHNSVPQFIADRCFELGLHSHKDSDLDVNNNQKLKF